MRNNTELGNKLLSDSLAQLEKRLPSGWRVAVTTGEPKARLYRPDAAVQLRAPDGTQGRLLVEVKSRLTAQNAAMMAPQLAKAVSETGAVGGIVVSRYLSPMARERLKEAGLSWIDATGNIRVTADRPALCIEAQGADRDPSPVERGLRSLKGAKAARLVRALVDWSPPVGLRELAERAQTDAGYASRVVTFLERESVVSRGAKGEVAEVSWQDLLRRWCADYNVARTNRPLTCLAPRGIPAVIASLKKYQGRWALTGSMAVPEGASISPGRLLTCYIADLNRAMKQLDLREADQGANVLLLEPFDPVIWERMRSVKGLSCVAMSQCVADLLTGPGREPSEGEALIKWMGSHLSAWRG